MLNPKCKTYIAAAEECIDVFESAIGKVDVRIRNAVDREWAFIGMTFACGMIRNYMSVAALAERGYVRECSLIHRATYEILINWLYIGKDYKPRATQYIDYLRTQEDSESENSMTKESFLATYRLNNKSFRTDNWSGLTLWERAKCCEQDLEESHRGLVDMYGWFYKPLSAHAHADPSLIKQYLSFNDLKPKMETAPNWDDAERQLNWHAAMLLYGLNQANEQFDLGCDEALDKLSAAIGLKAYVESAKASH